MLNTDIICSFTGMNVANLRGAARSQGFTEESFVKLAELQKKVSGSKAKGTGSGKVSDKKTPAKPPKNKVAVPKASKKKQK